MNKDQFKGKAESLKGLAKEAAGVASGNDKMQVEGAIDRAKGVIQEKVGDVKKAIGLKRDKSRDE